MTRRRLAVLAAVLAALVGEWLGHSVAYYRVAGLAGLEAGITSGIHAYMLPLGAVLLVGAAVGSTAWMRGWQALGRRLDRAATLLDRLRRGHGMCGAAPKRSESAATPHAAPRFMTAVAALALPLAALQSSLYLVQENLERSFHGMPTTGITPLVDGFGAALWIQAFVALVMASLLVLAMRRLGARVAAAHRWERLARLMWQRWQRGTSSPAPARADVGPAHMLFRSTLWQRPPPAPSVV